MSKTIIKYLILQYILLIPFVGISQNTKYNYKHYFTKDGLPNNFINDIYKDSDGFIWLATRDDISRYDGHSFKTYNTILDNNQKIPSYSKNIFESADGKLWVFGPTTYSFYFDGIDFTLYSKESVFAYPDKNNNIWFVNDSSLIKVDIRKLKISTSKEYKNSTLHLVCKERNNKIWVFHKFDYNQLIEATHNNATTYTFNNNKKHIVYNTLIDSKNSIWISTLDDGVQKFNPFNETFNTYNTQNKSLPGNIVNQVYEMDSSTMWIATSKGIDILNTNNNTHKYITQDFESNNTLSDNSITSIFKDNSGAILIGTRFGLNIMTEQRFKHFSKSNKKNSILHNNVHSFIEDNLQNIWIASTGGLNKYDIKANTIINYPIDIDKKNSLKAPPLTIVPDEKDNFWIGTWQGGVYSFNTKTHNFKQYNLNYGTEVQIGHNSAMALLCDSNNDIWIGSWGKGLFKYNKKTNFISNKYLDANYKSLNNQISTIIQDNTGRYWVGTMHGLYLFDTSMHTQIKQFFNRENDSSSISNNQINTLLMTDSFLWVGTAYGLNKIDLKTHDIKKLFTSDGLPSNRIMSITNDNDDNLWVATKKGLAKIICNKFAEDQYTTQILTIPSSDELQSDNFIDRSIYKTKNGDILLGGTNGFNAFSPNKITFDTTIAKCVFTKLIVDDKEIIMGDSLFGEEIIQEPISKTKNITLSYKHNSFSLEFISLNYTNLKDVKYKYMLKGFDKNWRFTNSKNRVITYSNINKGYYEFIVYAANTNTQWNKNPLSLKIKVIPPWWQTIVFYIIVTLFIISLFVSFYKLRLRILEKQKKQLEDIVFKRTEQLNITNASLEKNEVEISQQNSELLKHRNHLEELIDERTSELNIAKQKAEESDKLKSAFLANMSHEIRTPLNAIVGFSSLFKDTELTKEEIDQYVSIIINNSNSLSTIINDIIDISVIEAGQLKLTPSYFNVDEVMLELVSTYNLKNTNNLEIKFVKDKNQKDLTLYSDEVRFRQVMTNIINNACKFTQKGFIKFGYNLNISNVEFFIQDSGTGILLENKNDVFKFFQKVSPTPDTFYSGTGLGLTICQELVSKMGGKIWFESEKNIGTKFLFTIPHE